MSTTLIKFNRPPKRRNESLNFGGLFLYSYICFNTHFARSLRIFVFKRGVEISDIVKAAGKAYIRYGQVGASYQVCRIVESKVIYIL